LGLLYLAAYNGATSQAQLRLADLTTGNTTNLGSIGDGSAEIDGFTVATTGGAVWVRLPTNAGAIPPGGVLPFAVIFDAGMVTSFGTNTACLVLRGTYVNTDPIIPLTMIVAPPDFVTIAASALSHGAISPSGDVVVAFGGTTNFVVTAGQYYHVESVLTNGSAVAGVHGGTVTNVLWQNIVNPGSIVAGFGASVAPGGTPEWWLALYGLTNGTPAQNELSDSDHDGLCAWQEYIVGTDPTNQASALQVRSVVSDGATDTVRWLSSGLAPGYNLFYSTNLGNAGGGWLGYSNNILPTPPTNTLDVPRPGRPAFYKVTVTN